MELAKYCRYAVEVITEEEYEFLKSKERHHMPDWEHVKETPGTCLYFKDSRFIGYDDKVDIYTHDPNTVHVMADVYIFEAFNHTFNQKPRVGQYWRDSSDCIGDIYYICGKASDGQLVLEYPTVHGLEVLINDGTIELDTQVKDYEDHPPEKVLTGTSLIEDYDNLLGEDG